MKASYAKIIDAFIQCPTQMCEILYKYFNEETFNIDGMIVYLRGSDKISPFYSALRNMPLDRLPNNVHNCRTIISMCSLYYDIPINYYLDLLKQEPDEYYVALTNKAMICRTTKCKNWITGLLIEFIENVEKHPSQRNANVDINFMKFSIELLNYENISEQSSKRFGSKFIAIVAVHFGRYDIAEKASENCEEPCSLNEIIDLEVAISAKHYQDPQRAYKIMRKLLSNDEDREKFDEYIRTKTISVNM